MGDSGNVTAGASAQPSAPTNYTAMALTAAGGITGAIATRQSGLLNKRIANSNAKIAEAKADDATKAGDFAATRTILKARAAGERERGAQASSGTIAGAGTGALAIADSEQAGAMDALMIKRNAAREALGFKTQAVGERMRGAAEDEAGKMGTLTTLLNTGTKLWMESDTNAKSYHGEGMTFDA